MATEKILIFDEAGNAKRMKVRIARFLDNEPVTASDKENIRTTLDVDDSLSGTFTTPLSVTSASDSSFTGGGNVGIGTSTPTSTLDIEVSGANGAEISLNQTGTNGRDFRIGSTGTGYGSAGNLIFYDATAGAERWRINSTGNLVAGSGLGIDFGSGASTTLDDYEEGTHTTTLTPSSSGTITLDASSNSLSYTRVGRKITVSGALGVSAVSSPVGNYINFTLPLQIADLDELSGHFAASCVVLNAAGSMGSYSIIGLDGESSFRLYKNTSNSAVATAADFSGDETIYVSVTYFTTA